MPITRGPSKIETKDSNETDQLNFHILYGECISRICLELFKHNRECLGLFKHNHEWSMSNVFVSFSRSFSQNKYCSFPYDKYWICVGPHLDNWMWIISAVLLSPTFAITCLSTRLSNINLWSVTFKCVERLEKINNL